MVNGQASKDAKDLYVFARALKTQAAGRGRRSTKKKKRIGASSSRISVSGGKLDCARRAHAGMATERDRDVMGVRRRAAMFMLSRVAEHVVAGGGGVRVSIKRTTGVREEKERAQIK